MTSPVRRGVGAIVALACVAGAQVASGSVAEAAIAPETGPCRVNQGQTVVIDFAAAPKATWPRVPGAEDGVLIYCNKDAGAPTTMDDQRQAILTSAKVEYTMRNDLVDNVVGIRSDEKNFKYWMFSVGDPKTKTWDMYEPLKLEVNTFIAVTWGGSGTPQKVKPEYAQG